MLMMMTTRILVLRKIEINIADRGICMWIGFLFHFVPFGIPDQVKKL